MSPEGAQMVGLGRVAIRKESRLQPVLQPKEGRILLRLRKAKEMDQN
ncbi:MAG TPA: hypothetical protein VF988_03080 [Verrucomicrobiae bacterium]